MLAYLRKPESKSIKLAGAATLVLIAITAASAALSSVSPPSERLFVSSTGYTLRYPADWIVEDTRRDSFYESELIREPRGRAAIMVSSHSEPRLKEVTGRAALIKEIELAFLEDDRYTLDFLDWLSTDLGAKYNGYAVSGSFENDGMFVFREIGIFDPTGKQLTFRSEVRGRNESELSPIVDDILLSVRPDPKRRMAGDGKKAASLSAEEAKTRIEQLPYFALYREAAFERGEKHRLEVEDGGTLWHVGLYTEGNGISFPVARWRVDKETGAISKVLP